LLSLCI